MKFSVLMSVYYKEKPTNLESALYSVVNQTIIPSEIILVKDGLLTTDLDFIIDEFSIKYPSLLKIISLPENLGLSNALNIGLKNCTYDYIARMDTDDISVSNRFEKQLKCFKENEELSIVGGSIAEFIDDELNIVGIRKCPLTDNDIKRYMKSRCGLNHVSVMMKREDVINAGNYQEWFWNEDYFLWIRMMECGYKFQNIEDILVNVRVGADMYARRGGIKYFKSEAKLQKYMWENKIINFPRYIFNISVRFTVQILMPNKVRGFIFQKLFRN